MAVGSIVRGYAGFLETSPFLYWLSQYKVERVLQDHISLGDLGVSGSECDDQWNV